MFFLLLRINGPLFFCRNILPSDQLILPVNSRAAGSCQPVPNLVSGQCDAGAKNEYIAAVRQAANGSDAIIHFFSSGGDKDTGAARHALDDAVVGGPVFQHRWIWCLAGGALRATCHPTTAAAPNTRLEEEMLAAGWVAEEKK
jgi:hypothetical protein